MSDPRTLAAEADREPAPDPLQRWRRQWLALGPRRHAAALVLLAMVGLVLHHRSLLDPRPHNDEEIYIEAAARVASGRSPFQVRGYYYPTAFAVAWAATERLAGPVPAFRLWRIVNSCAAVLLVWLAAAHLPGNADHWWRNALVCAPLLAVPGFSFALRTGNLSPLTALLVASGVLLAGRRWMLAGVLLGASVAIKPFALPALVVLAAPRRTATRPEGAAALQQRGRHLRLGPEQRASALGLMLGALLLLAFPYTRELISQPVEMLSSVRSVSFARLLELAGLPLPRPLVLVLLYAGLWLAGWRATHTRSERAMLALAGAMIAAPLVWTHTMLLGLPMLTAALALHAPDLVTRSTPGDPGHRRRRLVALAAFALVALQLFFQPGGFDHRARWLQVALMLPMLCAPPITAAFVAHAARRRMALTGDVLRD